MKRKYAFCGGSVVLPTEILKVTLLTEGEKIAGMLSPQQEIPAEYEIVDVSGRILMPGLIDTHVHMWDPSPLNYREDWQHGSACAASGGITTIVEMPLSVPPVVDRTGFELKLGVASAASCVDFAFWGGLTPGCLDQLEELDSLGCVAYKGFMSFANPDYPQITDGYLVRGMRIAEKFDGLIGVHAENAEVADFGGRDMAASGTTDYSRYDEARPWWVELEAIQRAVLFSDVTGARLYICHMTVAEGAQFLKEAKCRGSKVSVETCPHYLLFDKSVMNEKGSYAKCNPPIRSRENVEKLWEYVFDGTIDTIGSDHGPYSDEDKVQNGNFFAELCGFGGYDAMLPGLITEGVHKRGLSYVRLAQLTAGNAARIMGLDYRKGSLLPGMDADIVVIDPDEEWTFDGEKSLTKIKTKNNIYHGAKRKGRVKQTWCRGELVYDGREIVSAADHGQYIPKGKKEE